MTLPVDKDREARWQASAIARAKVIVAEVKAAGFKGIAHPYYALGDGDVWKLASALLRATVVPECGRSVDALVKARAWRAKDEQGDDLIDVWKRRPAHSDERLAAEIIERLERELAEYKSRADLAEIAQVGHSKAHDCAPVSSRPALQAELNALHALAMNPQDTVPREGDTFTVALFRQLLGVRSTTPLFSR